MLRGGRYHGPGGLGEAEWEQRVGWQRRGDSRIPARPAGRGSHLLPTRSPTHHKEVPVQTSRCLLCLGYFFVFKLWVGVCCLGFVLEFVFFVVVVLFPGKKKKSQPRLRWHILLRPRVAGISPGLPSAAPAGSVWAAGRPETVRSPGPLRSQCSSPRQVPAVLRDLGRCHPCLGTEFLR